MLLNRCRLGVVRRVDVVLQEVRQWQICEGCDGRLHAIALRVDGNVVISIEVHSGASRAEQLSFTLSVTDLDGARLVVERGVGVGVGVGVRVAV